MKSPFSPKPQSKRSRQSHSRLRKRRHLAVQALQARELMAADFNWDGDVLQVNGSESDDFIAVQTSQLGTQIATDDAFISEFEGRSINSAAAIEIFGGGGDDLLFSYLSPVPVSLMGGSGDDFLYSDNLSDILDGGDGSDWIFSQNVEAIPFDALQLGGLDLDLSSLNGIPQIDENNLIELQVEIDGQADLGGTTVDLAGIVEVGQTGIGVELSGTVATWDNAFGIPEFDLSETTLTLGTHHDFQAGNGYRVELQSSMDADGTSIEIEGAVEMTADSVAADFTGSVAKWEDAFGIEGLDLREAQLIGYGSVDAQDNTEFGIGIQADLLLESTVVDIAGEFSVTPDRIEGEFTASVEHWNDAFGIEGLTLSDSELNIEAYTDRADDYSLHIDLLAEMEIDDKNVDVTGDLDLRPDRIDATLSGSVDHWDDAFGIEGLTLSETDMEVIASSNRVDSSELQLNLSTDLDIDGTNVAVEGAVELDDDGMEATLIGTVDGEWAAAMGVLGLNLHDTELSVRAAKNDSGSELEFGIAAGIDVLGTAITVNGSVAFTPEGTNTNLTGSVTGEWSNAFGIDLLDLRDTELTIANDPEADGELSISVDTDLSLFGGYIDVIGDVALGTDGPAISFSPPRSYDFVDLLGIPGFTLDDADLEISAGLGGIEVVVDTTMDMGSIDVGFTGAFAIGRGEVSASLTGRVDQWNNAFDVAGLNLEDIVMTLGAESDQTGASMFIGLGAEISIGSKELEVAGLVGVGSTGWDVAFRGEIDSLSTEDLITFANTISQAGAPDATEIPEDALGDFEVRDAYINFAPKGGNEDLGITDGFGIGGEFYEDGALLAEGEFEVDMEQFTFEVVLEIPELKLGPVELSDVLIDIRIAASDSHYKVAGTAELMGSNVSVAGEIYGDGTFLVTGTANLNIAGMAATATFTVDRSGIFFEAAAQVSIVNAIKGSVTGELVDAAENAQAAIDKAQAAVDVAKRGVQELETQLADARAEAQQEIDEIKSDIDDAKKIVDSVRANRDYWYRVRRSRYYAWRSAVSASKRAPWYKYAYYKGREASKYASYIAAAGTYSTRVVAYNTALGTYNAVKATAGWALDTAGVEANPEVLRLNVLLTTARIAVNTADKVLDGVEAINSEALQFLNVLDSLKVDQITLSGKVETAGSVAVHAEVDYSFNGRSYSFAMQADTDKLVEQLAGRLASAIF